MSKRPGRDATRRAVGGGTRTSPGANTDSAESKRHSRPSPRSLYAALRAPGGTILVLRAFLGITFTFAALQKLSSHTFFSAHAAGSFQEQLYGAIITSPLHHLLSPATHAPLLVGLVIACGELAVGLGTLFGLFGRVAALGGMLLSLSFFLTVSYNDSPYYYGADIVFLFAWTPFVLGGSGQLSLDGVLARRAAVARGGVSGSSIARRSGELERRVLLERATAAGLLAALAAALGGIVAGLGHLGSQPQTASGAPTLGGAGDGATGTAHKGRLIGLASSVPVGGAAAFTDPSLQSPAFVLQPKPGTFVAFSRICTHEGCTVNFDRKTEEFVCPCHGSIFNATTGAVIQGPAPTPLPSIPVSESDGHLYVDG
jgi:thiosulfate dehydrogenase [quinone] large subunit